MGNKLPRWVDKRRNDPRADEIPSSGAQLVSERSKQVIVELEKLCTDEDSPEDARIQLLVEQLKLMVAGKEVMPIPTMESQIQWLSLVMKRGLPWMYNDRCSVGIPTLTRDLLKYASREPLELGVTWREDCRADAEQVVLHYLHRCFLSGTSVKPDDLNFMQLIPCKKIDLRNWVPVARVFDERFYWQRVDLLPIDRSGGIVLSGGSGDYMGSCPSRIFQELPFRVATKADNEFTVIRDRVLLPRTSVIGRCARLVVYLLDKYGREVLEMDALPSLRVLKDLVELPISAEEMWWERVYHSLIGDISPICHMDNPKDRSAFTQAVWERKPFPETKKQETKDDEEEECRVIQVTHDVSLATVMCPDGETVTCYLDDERETDPKIIRALEQLK